MGGCSSDMAVNSVVSASPQVHRDCDRLAMKVLLASYEKAGEAQGRLLYFISNSEIPAKGKLKYTSNGGTLWGYHPTKGDLWISKLPNPPGLIFNYVNLYYIDDDGKPGVWRADSKSKINEKYIINQDMYLPSFIWNGKDKREITKTKDSLTCEVSFGGEGSVRGGTYNISSSKDSIYWSPE